MAYVSIPKDLDQVKNKVAFGLTLRQIICFGAGASVGVPVYFMTRNAIGTTNASLCMMVILLPAFMMAIFEKDGLPLEQVLMNYIRNRYLRPEVRMYKSRTNRQKNRKRATDKKKAQNSKRLPSSDITRDSQIKGTLIRDPFEDGEEVHSSGVKISFAKAEEDSDKNAPRQPISDEIILQEIRKNIGYEYGLEPAWYEQKARPKPAPRYQYRGMPSFLANPTVMSFEEMAGFEEDDAGQTAETEGEEDAGYAAEKTDAGFDCNPEITSSDPRGMLPVEDYLDRLLNSVGQQDI